MTIRQKITDFMMLLVYNIHLIGGISKKMKMLISCPRGRTFDSFFSDENLNFAKNIGEVVLNPYARNMTKNETSQLLHGCDVYISVWGAARIEESTLIANPSLKAVAHLGCNPLPFICDRAWEMGIQVLTGEKYYAASAAEGTLAYILSTLRDIPEYSHRLKYRGEWKHSWDHNRGIVGKTVGLVNYNAVSAKLAQLLVPFNTHVIACDQSAIPLYDRQAYKITQMSESDVFATSDIISIHTPNGEKRYHTVDLSQLSLLKKGALVVDTSDGGVVNHIDLASILVTGRISAILDVCENQSFEMDESLLYLPNVTLMPHMAGPTPEIRRILTYDLLKECDEYIRYGVKPKHSITLNEAKNMRAI